MTTTTPAPAERPAPAAQAAAPASDRIGREFVDFAIGCGVLRFGEFTTKAGRRSPYFFNAGGFDDGAKLGRLASFYADRLDASGVAFELLFGPAYKGIPLVAAIAVELARRGRVVPFAFNRKEAKDHGEGGTLVGADPAGRRVVIVDDVISAGTSVRESVAQLRAAGAEPAAVLIALDRQERTGDAAAGDGALSAAEQVRRSTGMDVLPIATLADLLAVLDAAGDPALAARRDAVRAYRERHGA